MAIIARRDENSIISKMEKAPFNFFLTGSRFFGGVIPTSDWDYFVTDSPAVREFLSAEGFYDKFDGAQTYTDSTIVKLMERNDIQVQLVRDATPKAIAQDFLLKHCPIRNVPKESRKYLWDFALKMAFLHRPDLVQSEEVKQLIDERIRKDWSDYHDRQYR